MFSSFRLLWFSVLLTCFTSTLFSQRNENVIYRFAGLPVDGQFPEAPVISDAAGNLYGTTFEGGFSEECKHVRTCGTIFELSPPSAPGQSWRETVLYAFSTGEGVPQAGLVLDSSGNLYGETGYGEGAIFELSPPATPGQPWQFSYLYNFTGGTDGGRPSASMIFDSLGNLYGTTASGGDLTCPIPDGCGTVFELSPPSSPGGSWTESVLYAFNSAIGDGYGPISSLVFDDVGDLFGTTQFGFLGSEVGTVFKITPPPGGIGMWSEEVLYKFMNSRESNPAAGLVRDHSGNLYGTDEYGGLYQYGSGTVFELSPKPGNHWVESDLWAFTGGLDGSQPLCQLLLDSAGNLYGTTSRGGINQNGTVFKLSPNQDGTWNETTLHDFSGHADGSTPHAGLIVGRGKLLYGTTEYGGTTQHNFGTVFAVKP